MAIGIRISLKGLEQTVSRLQALIALGQDSGKSRTELHRRFGIQAMKWIDENFRSEGGNLEDGAWKELSENTIAGRIKRSNKILQNSGLLRTTFNFAETSTEVRVGSPSKVALWHEGGTAGPYPIVPRNAKALAFPMAAGNRRLTKVGRAFAQRSARMGSGKFKVGQNVAFATKVMHPGLVARRMLPRENEILPRLIRTAENWAAGVGVGGAAVTADD